MEYDLLSAASSLELRGDTSFTGTGMQKGHASFTGKKAI